MSTDPLEAVRKTEKRSRAVQEERRAALAQVPASRYAELGRLLGVSRQAARQLVERAKTHADGRS